MQRDGSRNAYFQQRIPADVKALAVGLKLALPVGDEFVTVAFSKDTAAIKVSLRTPDPSEAKIRQAKLAAHIEGVWRHLRANAPLALTHKQAPALAGELYRGWAAGEGREPTRGIVRTPVGEIQEGETAKAWAWVRDDDAMDDEPAIWAKLQEHLARVAKLDSGYSAKDDPKGQKRPLEIAFGAIIDHLLSKRAVLSVRLEKTLQSNVNFWDGP